MEHDKYIWPGILSKASDQNEVIIHGDYSENLQEKPKMEPQSMHFAKKSYTLHCTVVHNSDEAQDNAYAYHFSDVSTHNWCHTKCVETDIVDKFFPDQAVIRKKTDNCSTQYKCKWTFGENRERAMSSGKMIICYYGSSGHGRGLVDGMSSWGVKSPLRKEIINHDFYMSSAADLVDLFKTKQQDTSQFDRMYYTEITQNNFDSQTCPDPFPIPGSQKLHCIAFHPDGTIQTSRDICDCDDCFSGDMLNCQYRNDSNEEDDSDDREENEDDDEDMCSEDDSDSDDQEANTDNDDGGSDGDNDEDVDCEDEDDARINAADIVIPGQVIALRSPRDVHESFYLCVVDKVVKASEDTFYSYQHFILKDMEYIICKYLKKIKETKGFIQYKKLSQDVFVLPGEVFCPDVTIDNDYCLKWQEKQWLDDCV